MSKSKHVDKPILGFKEFILQDLKKQERIKNVLSIIFQDIYLFVSRISVVDSPEWTKIEAMVQELRDLHEDPHTTEGGLNRAKDACIRKLVALEEMRQYFNFLEKRGK